VAELRWGIEGGVDRWSVRHGMEVGGRPVQRSDTLGGGAALGWAQRGRRVSPPKWVDWAA
jgi:hypothetical protein